jgi:hypothetical protein
VLLLDSAVVAVVLAHMVRIAAVSTAIAITSASAFTVSLVVVMSVLLLTCCSLCTPACCSRATGEDKDGTRWWKIQRAGEA